MPATTDYYDQAATEVNSDLAAQTAPLNDLVSQYTNNQSQATAQVNQLFNAPKTGIIPQANAVTKDLKVNTAALGKSQKRIFDEAFARLNSMRASRASEAQTLAQQLGAPIPISMFTHGIDDELTNATADFAGGELNAQGLAAAGVRQAEAYSGTVLPMLRAREVQENKQFFDDKIATAQSQIAALRAQAPGLISAKAREYMVQDRQYKLDVIKANRDWYLAQQQVAQSKEELALRRDQLAAEPNGPQGIRRANMAKAAADYAERQDNALKYLDEAVNPGTQDIKQKVGVNPDTGAPIYKTVTVQKPAITDPNRLMDQILTSAGVNKTTKNKQFVKWLTKQIRLKGKAIGVDWSNWYYGTPIEGLASPRSIGDSGARTLGQLRAIPLATLESQASQFFHFNPSNYPKTANSDAKKHAFLVNWVWQQQESILASGIKTSH